MRSASEEQELNIQELNISLSQCLTKLSQKPRCTPLDNMIDSKTQLQALLMLLLLLQLRCRQ